MGVKVRARGASWFVFIDHRGVRRAKCFGKGAVAKKAAQLAATQIAARLATDATSCCRVARRRRPSPPSRSYGWRITRRRARLVAVRASRTRVTCTSMCCRRSARCRSVRSRPRRSSAFSAPCASPRLDALYDARALRQHAVVDPTRARARLEVCSPTAVRRDQPDAHRRVPPGVEPSGVARSVLRRRIATPLRGGRRARP